MFLKQLFCRHEFVDKCGIDDIRRETGAGNLYISWQEVCNTRPYNCQDDEYGYCDYLYQQCTKCGKKRYD